MRVLTLRSATLVAMLFMFSGFLLAQSGLQQATVYLSENAPTFGVNPNVQWRVLDNFTDKDDITHIRFLQTHNAIDVDVQMVAVHIKDGEVIHSTGNFIGKIATLASNREVITAGTALQTALQNRSLSTSSPLTPVSVSRTPNKETLFNLDDIAKETVKTRLLYIRTDNNEVRLVWESDIYEKDGHHRWNVRVDAQTGEVLRTFDQILHCDFGAPDLHDHIRNLNALEEMTCEEQEAAIADGLLSYKAYGEFAHNHDHSAHAHGSAAIAANSYRALPLTVESPNHGAFTLITNPQLDNVTASPNGWHDDNTNTYTITRGNNVHAHEDQNGNNGIGYSPDGGAALCFDWTFNPANNPETGDNRDAAIVNLFVWNNFMHDIYYNYGFTEACFNFQESNFGRGGAGGDYVDAQAQDGSGTNNANFGTPGDGGNPTMQMFLWTAAATTAFNVNSGSGGIVGSYGAVVAGFGPTNFSVTGDLVVVDDGTALPTEGCNALVNGAAVSGNIAVIDRGTCNFSVKVLEAQNAGAIAAIVCNNVAGAPIAMAPGTVGGSVTIPSVMISQGDCATIRAQIPTVNVTLSASAGTWEIDGDFDAGIVAHEYGHGISNRMTSSGAGCLGNAEQMGEGWSDFWGLVLTVQPSHTANTARGIGTYATGEPSNGGGIRPFPYTRDMTVNPQTYGDVAASVAPHGLGSIWCTMIWDLYWDLVDVYGYDTDLYNGTGGNNIAMNLVTQGCKFQGCQPGMEDGRDGILAADAALYGGANECIIWEAFARRGLGDSASQGSSASQTDQTEAFDLPPGLGGGSTPPTFAKTADKAMAACGEEITFTLTATGAASACGAAPSNVDIADILPAGLTYVAGSASNSGSEAGGTITWPQIASLNGTVTYTYRAAVDCANVTATPTAPVTDDVESGVDPLITTSNTSATSNWTIVNTEANSGGSSWYAEELEPNTGGFTENQFLQIGPLVLTNTSELVFQHLYDTEINWDGGRVEISTNGGTSWTDLGGDMTQNGYNDFIANNAATEAFAGLSNGWIETKVDLSSYAGASGCDGSDTYVRFNFYYDEAAVGTVNAINDGWYIDDIAITTEAAAVVVNTATITQAGTTQTVTECVEVELREVCIEPKVFLQGPLSGTTMTTAINGLLPATSPYPDTKSFGGTFPANATDWVYVELRNDNSAAPSIVEGQSAILLDDGTVVNPDGTPLCFGQAPGMWYVVIKHRNHLSVMTNSPIMLN